jgi:hypothetical protein
MRVVIYPNDHRPAHVHVIGPGCEAVFDLHCPEGPPELRENYDFTRKELGRIADALVDPIRALCAQWRVIHGIY